MSLICPCKRERRKMPKKGGRKIEEEKKGTHVDNDLRDCVDIIFIYLPNISVE